MTNNESAKDLVKLAAYLRTLSRDYVGEERAKYRRIALSCLRGARSLGRWMDRSVSNRTENKGVLAHRH